MQAKKNQITVAELATELNIQIDKVIAGLSLPDETPSETAVSAADANKLRRTVEAFNAQNNSQVVQLRLVGDEGENRDSDRQSSEPATTQKQMSNDDVKAIAKQAKVPQHMVRTLGAAIFEKQAAIDYTEGRNEAQIKHALSQVRKQGAEDFEQQIELKGLIDQFKKAESKLEETQEISDRLDNFGVHETLQRMGLIPKNPLEVIQNEYDEIVKIERASALAVYKFHNGEELTEQEKKLPVIMRLTQSTGNR